MLAVILVSDFWSKLNKQYITSSMPLHCEVSPVSSGASWARPALLTITCTHPSVSLVRIRWNMALTSSSLVTSHRMGVKLPLCPFSSWANIWNIFTMYILLERVSTQVAVVVVVVRELFSLVMSAICVWIRGRKSAVMRIVYHMAPVFIYCCILTTVDV